ncbi:lactose-binding lectin l-2-like [Conger conger]|uniref:lactose-binding lectin l-2-like n=1 Tax=Conger conger TaxID=82655 RepID=UPI002A5AA604|nr:lactose-binding lectin l-2-like [Conger conger]
MAIFTLPAFLVVAVLSSMTLGYPEISLGAEIGLCLSPCPEGWFYNDERCFQLIPDKKTWLDAELNCLRLGGNLASERSQADHEFLKKLNGNDEPFWIGLSDIHKEGTWLWSDGTSASSERDFLKWNRGQPNNAGQEHCVHSNFRDQKDWNDFDCEGTFPSICTLRFYK